MEQHALLAYVIEVAGPVLHRKVGNVPLIRVEGDLLPVAGVSRIIDEDNLAVLNHACARTLAALARRFPETANAPGLRLAGG